MQENMVKIQKNVLEIFNKLENIDQQNITQHTETLEQIQKTKTDYEILINNLTDTIEEKNIENMEYVLALNKDQEKLLNKIYSFLIDIQLHLEDVPKHITETKEAVGNMIESKQRTEKIKRP